MENQNTAKNEDLQIASRTRSKLCLEQTSIEAIQSEFIPPDLEETTNFVSNNTDAIDNYWTEFLNDFMMPFSKILKLFIFETHHYYYFQLKKYIYFVDTNVVGDDDDLVNDPEYVAATEKELGKYGEVQFIINRVG